MLVLVIVTMMIGCGGPKPEGGTASQTPNQEQAENPGQEQGENQNQEPEKAHKTWSQPPEMTIDPDKKYLAEVTTSKGAFTIELLAKEAPVTVNNFVFLAKEGFYDDVIFHRIIKSFMIQTGDPLGTGMGGPGYKFQDELPPALTYEPGVVAMANAGPNTNGSQFFICTGEDSGPILNPQPYYTVFGKIVDGMDTVLAIADTPVEMNQLSGDTTPSKPLEKVLIQSIQITEQ